MAENILTLALIATIALTLGIIARPGVGYALSAKYNADAIELGGGAEWLGPAHKLGFTDANDPVQNKKHQDELKNDGTHAIRPKADRKDKRPYESIHGTDTSINHKFLEELAVTPEEKRDELFEKMAGAVKVAARKAYDLVTAKNKYGRLGAGGKSYVEAVPVGRLGVHATDADGGCFWHAHVRNSRYGVTADGETYKLDDLRKFYREDRLWKEVFQATLKAELTGLFPHWDLKMDYERGVVVCTNVRPEVEALKLAGTRGPKIAEYMAKRGWEDTPENRLVAALYTRTTAPKALTKKELNVLWAEPVRQALGHGQVQAQPAPFVVNGVTPDTNQQPQKSRRQVRRDTLLARLKRIVQIVGVAVKVVFKGPQKTVKVKDTEAFLLEVRKPSRREAHRVALRSLRRQKFESVMAALKYASFAYKVAREPRLRMKKGDDVIIRSKAAHALTEPQMQKLRKLAETNGVNVYVHTKEEGLLLLYQGHRNVMQHAARQQQEQQQPGTQQGQQSTFHHQPRDNQQQERRNRL